MNQIDKLFKLKKQIERTENEIQRNEGKLLSHFDALKDELGLPEDTKQSVVLKKADKELIKLKEDQENTQERLDALLEEIEEKTKDWDD